MSRLIWSRAELERDAASNDGTCCFRTPLPDSSILGVAAALEPDESFEALFRCHYSSRSCCTAAAWVARPCGTACATCAARAGSATRAAGGWQPFH